MSPGATWLMCSGEVGSTERCLKLWRTAGRVSGEGASFGHAPQKQSRHAPKVLSTRNPSSADPRVASWCINTRIDVAGCHWFRVFSRRGHYDGIVVAALNIRMIAIAGDQQSNMWAASVQDAIRGNLSTIINKHCFNIHKIRTGKKQRV